MRKTKLLIIGNFGGNNQLNDGQTIKTKILYNELKKNTDWDIFKVDTFYRKRFIFIFFKSIWYSLKSKNIIILVSKNGMKLFFPLLYIFTIIFKVHVYHDVIGGNLSKYVRQHRMYKLYLNSFKQNWVETDLLKKELDEVGINNVIVIPNFRPVKAIQHDNLTFKFDNFYKFCTFSRVNEEKGIGEAINSVVEANKILNGKAKCRLDIYGPIDKKYIGEFNNLLMNNFDSVKYCGIVAPEYAVNTISGYYATLFPTHWEGESNAGTITESQLAGVPVIATDWRCNREMIRNGVEGLLYPSEFCNNLTDGILWMIKNNDKISTMKQNARKASEKYSSDLYIKKIKNIIES